MGLTETGDQGSCGYTGAWWTRQHHTDHLSGMIQVGEDRQPCCRKVPRPHLYVSLSSGLRGHFIVCVFVCVCVFRSEGAHFIVCVFVCVCVFRSEGSHFIVCVFVCLSVFRSEGSQL